MVVALWLLVASGDLHVVTYNVAGLPEVFSQARPSRDMARIGALLRDYDVAVVQEDFWYHDDLLFGARHRFRSSPYRTRLDVLDIGDGLNQLSRFPFAQFQRTTWNHCNGGLGCANDCLAKKGYTASVLTLPDISIYLYNLHMDAGECAGDFPARAAELAQLSEDINRLSIDTPVIVAGDTNLDVTFAEDRASLDTFLANTQLRDVCRELSCGREVIDRVLLRGPLEPVSWQTPQHFVGLSDHEPVAVKLRYLTPPLLSSSR